MAYSPTNWINKVTTLGPTNLNKLENGVQATATVADAALPASQSPKLIYDAKGDILVALSDNTPQRLAVGSDGYYLQADSSQPLGVKWAAGGGGGIPITIFDAKGDLIAGAANDTPAKLTVGADTTILQADSSQAAGLKWQTLAALVLQEQALLTIGTSLPASPVDGQEAILTDSLTAPTYAWRFKYVNGISDAYKWVFIGGSPLSVSVAAAESTASTTFVSLTTVGPTVTVPRNGYWDIDLSAMALSSGASYQYMTYDTGATAGTATDSAGSYAGTSYISMHRTQRKLLTGTPTSLVGKYRVDAGTGTFQQRTIRITPVRVS